MNMIEERDKAMRELIKHVETVCKEYDIAIVLNVCVDHEIEKGTIIQSLAQYVSGKRETLIRMLAGAILHSKGFRTLLIDSFELSEKMSTGELALKKENMN